MQSLEFNGWQVPSLPGIITRLQDFTTSFQSRPDDIWICAFMKCGSHWVNDILQKLCHPNTNKDQMKEKLFVEITHHTNWTDYPSPRILNTHLPYRLLPQSVKESKIIWCVRNTKDVAVSLFNHMKTIAPQVHGQDLTWDKYIQNFSHFHPQYFQYHNEWLDLLKSPSSNILRVDYEDMKLNTVKTVTSILRFLNLHTITEEEVQAVVSDTSIDKMIKLHADDVIELENVNLFPGTLYRKGIIGDWRNWFTEEQNIAFNKFYLESMEGRSYGFEKYMDL